MHWKTFCKTIFFLALASTIAPAWGQSGGGQLAAELNELRQQQRQLERDIAQYQTSIELLKSNGAGETEDSKALQTLENQLAQSRKSMQALAMRETELVASLQSGRTSPVSTRSMPPDPHAAEVARLKELLAAYHSTGSGENSAGDKAVRSTENSPVAAGQVPDDKVRLSGPEGIAAIRQINERLTDTAFARQGRELDIVFHVEVRRNAALVSSSSHKLTSLGNAQFIGKISLTGGTANITVRGDSWVVDLEAQETGDYLVTLSTPSGGESELYVIPVQALLDTGWTDAPAWLPPIGTSAAAPSGP
jgi:hypothetical protein